jgi:hypothetical protein
VLWSPFRVSGQSVSLAVDEMRLEEALSMFRAQTGIDVVYAQRLVRGKKSSCRYSGGRPREALSCLVEGTGLSIERVRSDQFVLVADRSSGASRVPPERATVTGVVVNGENGEALRGAHVFVPSLQRGTTTNDAGYFALASLPPGAYEVQVSYIGFDTRTVELSTAAEDRSRIDLRPTVVVGEEIVVEGSSTRSPASVSAVSGLIDVPLQELAALPVFLGERDLFQSLRWMPGVRQSAEVGGALSVRGAATDQNLYLLDGVPVYHPWHTFNLFSTFQEEALKNVQLYKGAFPARYGGRLSAVLDTQMKDGRREEPSATAAISPISLRSVAELPLTDEVSLMVAGRRSYLDLIFGRARPLRTLDGTADTLRLGYYFYDGNTKVTWQPSSHHHFSLAMYRGRDNLDVRLPFQSLLERRRSNLGLSLNHQWGNQFASLRYRYLEGDRWFTTVTVYQSDYRAREKAEARPTELSEVNSNYEVQIQDTGVKVHTDYFHSLSHQIEVGGTLVYHRFNSLLNSVIKLSEGAVDSLRDRSELNALETALYVQDTWQITDRWRLQPGLRLSSFSRGNHIHVKPRLHVRYSLDPTWAILRGSISTQVQYMHRLRDQYSFAYDVTSSRWIPTGATVDPARGIQISGGIESRPLRHLTVSLDGYFRHFRQILVPEDQYRSKDGLVGPGIEIGAILQQYTPGFMRAYGMDVLARYRYDGWRTSLSYGISRTLTRSHQTGAESYTPSPRDLPHVVKTAVQWNGTRWLAAGAAELRSGYPATVPVARYRVEAPTNEQPTDYLYRPRIYNERLPAYARVDLTVGYRFEWLNLDWLAQAQVYNVTGHRNIVGRQYRPTENSVTHVNQYGLPLLPMVNFKARW